MFCVNRGGVGWCDQEREYERLLENDPPSAVEAESFNFIVLQVLSF